MVGGIFEAHPLLSSLEQLADEVLGEGAELAPSWVVEAELALGDLLDGGGVIF